MRRNVLVRFLMLVLIVILFLSNVIRAKASGIKEIDDFNHLPGNAQYLGEKYRNNYNFDIEETGLLDKGKEMFNDFANLLFNIINLLTLLVVSVFYFAMDLDIGELFSPFLNSIQKALHNSIFEPLLLLAFIGTAIILIKNLARRDLVGIVSEIAKVIGLMILSALIVTHSGTVLSYSTKITKDISVSALTSINGTTRTKSFAADTAGVLWVNLVHMPWETIQFGKSESDVTVNKFMSTKYGTEARKKLVKQYMEENPDFTRFDKSFAWQRIPSLGIYLLPFAAKSAIYLLVAGIQLLFQVMAIAFTLFSPVILLLAMIPGYEQIISIWLKKLFESQLGILIITYIMGILIKIDSLLYSLVPTMGWMIVVLLQIFIGIGLVALRKQILKAFVNIQRSVQTPGYLKAKLRRSGNLYDKFDKTTRSHKKNTSMNANKNKTNDDKVTFQRPNKNRTKESSNNEKRPDDKRRPRTDDLSDVHIKKRPIKPIRTDINFDELGNSNIVNFQDYKMNRKRPRLYSKTGAENEGNAKDRYTKVRDVPVQNSRVRFNRPIKDSTVSNEHL